MDSTITANAISVLREVMQHRNWYGDKIERRKASVYKSLLKKGGLSYEKSVDILTLMGWHKVEEEVWQQP